VAVHAQSSAKGRKAAETDLGISKRSFCDAELRSDRHNAGYYSRS
jgi:hypothetical protein